MGTAPGPAPQGRYYIALDGARGIFFLCILSLHVLEVWNHLPLPSVLGLAYAGLQWSWMAVDMFFILSGFLLPHVAKMLGSADRARRTVATIGFIGAASFVFIHTQTADARLAMVFLGMASFCNDLVMPCAWGSCMDIGGKYAGTLSGSMNMMGNFAGFFSPWIGGIILDKTGDWNIYLYTFVAAYALGALCWPFLSSRHSLDEGPEAAHT